MVHTCQPKAYALVCKRLQSRIRLPMVMLTKYEEDALLRLSPNDPTEKFGVDGTCIKHRGHICTRCDPGFRLTKTKLCEVNRCFCVGGNAALGGGNAALRPAGITKTKQDVVGHKI